MAKDKISKETAIKSILDKKKKNVNENLIVSYIVQKCPNISDRTIRRYFEEAEKKFQEYLKRINPIKEKAEEEAIFEATKEVVKIGILNELERKQYLSSWIKGEVIVIKTIETAEGCFTTKSQPTIAERRGAMSELNKMEGSYAPTKTDITSGGENLKAPIFNIILDNDE